MAQMSMLQTSLDGPPYAWLLTMAIPRLKIFGGGRDRTDRDKGNALHAVSYQQETAASFLIENAIHFNAEDYRHA